MYDVEKHKHKKREYDTWMYGPESPHKDAKVIDWEGTDVYKKMHSPQKFDARLIHTIDDEELLKEGLESKKESMETMSKQDEIIFNILKWIFNAIKKEKEVVNKLHVMDQLKENKDTLKSLGFKDFDDFATELNRFPSSQDGFLTWEEFIDFFISKSGLGDTKSEWWKTFLTGMHTKEKAKLDAEFYNSPEEKARRLNDKAYLKASDKKKLNFDISENEADNLKRLSNSRVDAIQSNLKQDPHTTKPGYDTTADELDIFKNKPQCLLLDSH